MKIVILTPADHFHSPIILRELGLNLQDAEITLVTTPKLGSKGSVVAQLGRISSQSGIDYLISFGVAKICYLALNFMERMALKPVSRRKYLSVDDVASHFGFRRFALGDINSPSSISVLKDLKPDIIITLFFNQIVRREVLQLPRYGSVNIHPSLLPLYRGISPCFWALANGEPQSGISIHYLTGGIDTGNIIWQEEIPITPRDSYFTLYRRCAERCAQALPEVLSRASAARTGRCGSKGILQTKERSSYFGVITPKAVRRFRRLKRRFWLV